VVEDAYLTAPEGPLAADVRLNGAWPWVAVILGAGLIAVGGFLFSPSTHDQPAASTSWSPR
jgi:hypothetical protein